MRETCLCLKKLKCLIWKVKFDTLSFSFDLVRYFVELVGSDDGQNGDEKGVDKERDNS